MVTTQEVTKVKTELETYFRLPFEPHRFQWEGVVDGLRKENVLIQYQVGLGKTVVGTMIALMRTIRQGAEQILILCPPILIDQWAEFLSSVKGIPSVMVYRGSPAQREKMLLTSAVTVASYNIFRGKKDHKKFVKMCKDSKVCIIADELSLKSLSSQTYRKLKMLIYGRMRPYTGQQPDHPIIALNATPVSDLGHVYNWCALFNPDAYVSRRTFDLIHVDSTDHWGNVTAWRKKDLLSENMEKISIDTDKTIELPDLVEIPVRYALSKKHLRLYNEVVQQELDNLPEHSIELALNAMFSLLQRLVLLPKDFGLDIDPPILEYINGYIDQLGDGGLLIYTRHVAVSDLLASTIPDSVAIYGGVSQKARESAMRELHNGGKRILIGNIESLGVGLNLQMLNHVIFTEVPYRDDKLTQSLGRIHRQEQRKTCFASYPLAIGTVQEKIFNKLLKNQGDLQPIMKTKSAVKDFLS